MKIMKGTQIGQHTVLVSRRRGNDGWIIKCSCGRVFTGWRYLCEERFEIHAEPVPEMSPERMPLWWDDASYKRYQSMP